MTCLLKLLQPMILVYLGMKPLTWRTERYYQFSFVDSDSYTVKEEYLGLVVGSKGAEELCKKICEVLRDKGVDINQLRFHG